MVLEKKKRGPGGAQPGAGRPRGQGKYGEPTQAIRIPLSMVERVMELISSQNKTFAIPLYNMTAQAGEPFITDSDAFEMFNLNKNLFISDPQDHFLVRVCGYSMKDAGILPNDLLLVNRKREAFNNDIIVASVNGGVVVKRLSIIDGITKLISDNKDYDDIIDQTLNLHLWGVVARVIREY